MDGAGKFLVGTRHDRSSIIAVEFPEGVCHAKEKQYTPYLLSDLPISSSATFRMVTHHHAIMKTDLNINQVFIHINLYGLMLPCYDLSNRLDIGFDKYSRA